MLELSALATSGHTWRVVQDGGVATLAGERTSPAGAATGAPSIQEFEFRATRIGRGSLVMAYGRPWESAPLERLELTVIVRHRSPGES